MVVTEHWLAAEHAWCFPLEDGNLLLENALQKTTEEVTVKSWTSILVLPQEFQCCFSRTVAYNNLKSYTVHQKKKPQSRGDPHGKYWGNGTENTKTKNKTTIKFCISDVKMLR